MKRIISLLFALTMIFTLSLSAFAGQDSAPVIMEANTLLNDSANTQTITTTERAMITELLQNNSITREELNRQLTNLSNQTEAKLYDAGYNENQIDVIKSFDENMDAYNHIYGTNSRMAKADPTLVFRYGLAGSNTKKSIRVAYDMRWSACPFFTFTDSFGIGWIAADSNSYEVVTKTDNTMAQVQYYTVGGQAAGGYRDVSMDKSTNGIVIGNPIIGSAGGNYGKNIGGVTQLSTQSGSSNIETIHLFVTYGHTTITVTPGMNVSLQWKKANGVISFSPRITQSIVAKGDHTFKYNAQGDIVAK